MVFASPESRRDGCRDPMSVGVDGLPQARQQDLVSSLPELVARKSFGTLIRRGTRRSFYCASAQHQLASDATIGAGLQVDLGQARRTASVDPTEVRLRNDKAHLPGPLVRR